MCDGAGIGRINFETIAALSTPNRTTARSIELLVDPKQLPELL
jgi:hypothetical protein